MIVLFYSEFVYFFSRVCMVIRQLCVLRDPNPFPFDRIAYAFLLYLNKVRTKHLYKITFATVLPSLNTLYAEEIF